MKRLTLVLATLLLMAGCGPGANPPAPTDPPAAPQPTAPEPVWKVQQIGLVSESVGWVRASGGPADVPLAVLRTTDGGQTWQDVTPKEFPRDGVYGPTGYFADVNSAWVAVRQTQKDSAQIHVARTADGGQSWRVSMFDVLKWEMEPWLSFINDKEGWLVVASGPAVGTMYKSVYHTADAGAHWEALSRGAGQGATPTPEHLPNTEYVTGVTFRSGTEGWVTDLYRTTPDVPLYHTGDGGRTWQRQPLAYPEVGGPFRYCDAFPPRFFGDKQLDGVLILGCRSDPGWVVPYVTVDGGKAWQARPGVPGVIFAAGNYDFISLQEGWVLAESGALYATTDGGLTWEKRHEALDPYGQIDFADVKHGWAVGRDGALLATADGGSTWIPVEVD